MKASPEGPDEGLREQTAAAIYADAEGVDPDERRTVVDAVMAVWLPLLTAERERLREVTSESRGRLTQMLAERERADRLARAVERVEALVDEEETVAGGPGNGWVSTTDLRAALSATDPERA